MSSYNYLKLDYDGESFFVRQAPTFKFKGNENFVVIISLKERCKKEENAITAFSKHLQDFLESTYNCNLELGIRQPSKEEDGEEEMRYVTEFTVQFTIL